MSSVIIEQYGLYVVDDGEFDMKAVHRHRRDLWRGVSIPDLVEADGPMEIVHVFDSSGGRSHTIYAGSFEGSSGVMGTEAPRRAWIERMGYQDDPRFQEG